MSASRGDGPLIPPPAMVVMMPCWQNAWVSDPAAKRSRSRNAINAAWNIRSMTPPFTGRDVLK